MTIDAGTPLSPQVLFAVSAGELAMEDTCPLLNVKLNVSTHPEPLLPTSSKPSCERLYLLPHASSNPIENSTPTPSSHHRCDILSFISTVVSSLREHAEPGAAVARAVASW